MAVGRVGGTKSKIRGKVGSVVYRITKDGNGSLQQVLSSVPIDIAYSNSDKQAAQRMFVGMVQGMMSALRPIATISNQYALNRAQALNAFSSTNILKVREDAKAHWYDSTSFYYPTKSKLLSDYPQVGGYWSISLGSLPYDLFDWSGEDVDPDLWAQGIAPGRYIFAGIKMYIPDTNATVADFMRAHKMTRRDSVHFVWWERDVYWMEGNEDPQEREGYHYISITLNPYLSNNMLLRSVPIEQLFLVSSDTNAFAQMSNDGKFYAFGRMQDRWDNVEEVGWLSAFSISYPDGRKMVSSSTLRNPDDFDPKPYMVSPPAGVFGTWIGKGLSGNYPPPF